MAAPDPTITITPAKLGFVLSILAVLTVGWNVAAHEVTQNARLDQTDRNREMFAEDIKALKTSQDGLKEAVIRLTTVIENGPKRALYSVPVGD